MTDPTPTRAEVEVFSPHVGWDAVPTMKLDTDLGRWVRLSDYAALRERAEAAEKRAYDLAVAIMGGEDAPGYADSISTQQLVDQQREMAREWMDAISPAALTARLDAEWNAAIEAAAKDVEEYGASFGSYNPSEPREVASDIRALRRAAPTDGGAQSLDDTTRAVLDRAERIVAGQSQQEQRTAEIFLRPTEGEA